MGKGAKRNNPCLCGSGKKFKHCCLSRREELGNKRFRRYVIKKRFKEASIKDCLYFGDSDCSEKIIKAHSIQNNKILNSLAEEGEVYMLKYDHMSEDSIVSFQKVGRGKATTFTGFCSKHDTEVFSLIENNDYNPDSEEHPSLFAFRAFAKEWHAKLSVEALTSEFSDNPMMSALNYGNSLALQDIDTYKDKFETILTKNKHDKLITHNITFESEFSFSVSSMVTLPYDFNGNNLPHFTGKSWDDPEPLFITIFPQNGKTFVILSYFESGEETFSFLEDQLLAKDKDKQKELITRLVLSHCENVVFSPSLIDSQDDAYKKKNKDVFKRNITLGVGESSIDKDIDLSLFV